jgi:hypothetical protein
MADDFDFAALAKSWQQQPVADDAPPCANDLAQASQRQREQKLLMYVEWAGAVIMLVSAIWLLLTLHDWLGYTSALFLLLGAVSTAYISWHVHRPILAYDNWSSSGLLAFRRQACQLSLRYYRYIQLSCAALILFTLILWVLHLLQLATLPITLLWFYSLIAAPGCLIGMLRLQHKIQQKAVEAAHLDTLEADFSQP